MDGEIVQKNVHFVSVPAHKSCELFPVVWQMQSRLPAVHNLYSGQSDTLVVGKLFIWSLTHGYKAHCYIVLVLSMFLGLLFKDGHCFSKVSSPQCS